MPAVIEFVCGRIFLHVVVDRTQLDIRNIQRPVSDLLLERAVADVGIGLARIERRTPRARYDQCHSAVAADDQILRREEQGTRPRIDGFTFKPGDRVTMIHCPLRDGRSGGAIGLVVAKDGTWYNPADGGCGAQEMSWRKWLEAGYASRAEAEAAGKK